MSKRRLRFGDIVIIQFPLQTPQGHEQIGYRLSAELIEIVRGRKKVIPAGA